MTRRRLKRWWRDVRRFVEWISAAEKLPQRVGHPMGSRLRSIVGVAGWLFTAEPLPVSESVPSEKVRSPGGLARWILAPDALPQASPGDPTGRRSTGSLIRWLLAPEQIPMLEADAVDSGPSVVRWLFAAEPLPPPTEETTASRGQEA
jgi:hypothetical protein